MGEVNPDKQTVITREEPEPEVNNPPPSVDPRFTLFYKNAHSGTWPDDNLPVDELYDVIGDKEKNSWDYITDSKQGDTKHLPAANTVFINANIALTDGTTRDLNSETKQPRTIPNLYDALTALATKISNISTTIEKQGGYSTADKRLLVTKPDNENTILIQPGKDTTPADGQEIANAPDDSIDTMRIMSGRSNSYIDIYTPSGASTNSKIKIISPETTVSEKATIGGKLIGNGGAYITAGANKASIDITDKDITFTINTNGSNHIYKLGAIIEAIQELNRRTSFIDSTMLFTDAINHFDVNTISGGVTDADYEETEDGLPAATDGHHSEGLSERSLLNAKLAKMKIIAYDPETNETIDVTGKNIPFTQELTRLDKNPLLSDETVISPETASIRMRGCPYLLQ